MVLPHDSTSASEEVGNLDVHFTFISNLNHALTPFVRENCFIHLTSFVHAPVDFLEPPQFPILLRQLSLQKVLSYPKKSRGNINKLMWMATHLRIPEKLNMSLAGCFNSPFLEYGDSIGYVALCAKLRFSTFPLNAKPWSCEAYIGVFPPSYSLNSWDSFWANNPERYFKYPGTWYYYDRSGIERRTFPSQNSRFYILFVSTKFHQKFLRGNHYGLWVKQHFGRFLGKDHISLLSTSVDRFLIFVTITRMCQLNQENEIVSNILSVKICFNCEVLHNFRKLLSQIPESEWSSKDIRFFMTP